MAIPQAVVATAEEYRTVCDRCLHDEAFADALIAAQALIARELSDPARLWRQIFDAYAEWLEQRRESSAAARAVVHAIDQRIAGDRVETHVSG